jgi:arrestin-related trafficking adapter 4/5/7
MESFAGWKGVFRMPSFNLFGTRGDRNIASLFEIRCVIDFRRQNVRVDNQSLDNDSDTVMLRGVESEASSQLLRGVVLLCLPAALRVEDVSLKMTGQLKIG